jgi:vitamin K-dependent gamma-carboxylase
LHHESADITGPIVPRPVSSRSAQAKRAVAADASPTPPSPLLLDRLFAPVDIASLVFFRIAFGAVMLWEVSRYFTYGWISDYYIAPTFHFTYYGFDWVKPWPGDGMYYHFFALGVLAAFVMAGFLYRLSAALFFLGFSYVFLLEEARYLNHLYLVALVSFVMILIPAHKAFSIDSLLRPGLRGDTAPAWALWLVRAQIAIPYIFGGIAKLNADWLRGEPLRMWLAERTDFPLIGQFFTQEWMVYLFAYGGLLLDLFVVPALLWRPTRPFALVAAFAFHLVNNSLFEIGIFPWFMMVATLMFLPPHWPRLLVSSTEHRVPGIGLKVGKFEGLKVDHLPTFKPSNLQTHRHSALGTRYSVLGTGNTRRYALLALLGLYLAWQVLFPLRNLLYPGDVAWTEEGHRFSWRMKLRDKAADSTFYATDPATGNTWEIYTRDYLKSWQKSAMESRPDMILQFAHHIADDLRRQGHAQIEVRARVTASLNDSSPRLLIDPTVDLAKQPRTLLPSGWIIPFDAPQVLARPGEE